VRLANNVDHMAGPGDTQNVEPTVTVNDSSDSGLNHCYPSAWTAGKL